MASKVRRHRGRPKAERNVDSATLAEKSPRASGTEIACWAVVFAAAVAALIWRQSTLFFYSWSDEQIHFYVARRMAEGAVLYRDIDSARPPLALLPLSWLIRMGSSPLLAGRSLVLGTQLATAGLLLWGGWRLASWRAGALAALLFLTSPEAFTRVHYTGIHLVALTASACVLFSLRAQPFRAGLCLGLTLAADQHGLVVGGIVVLWTVVRRPRDAFWLATGSLVVCAGVFGSVWMSGGRHLWGSLLGIHLYHLRVGQGASAQFWQILTPWLFEHAYLLVGVGLATALLGTRHADSDVTDRGLPRSRVVRLLLVVAAVHVAVVLAMKQAAFLYVVVIVPTLTLLAGVGFHATVASWRQRSQLPRARSRRAARLMLAGVVAAPALIAGGWAAARSHRERLDDRQYSFWPHVLHGQVSRFQQMDVAVQGIGESMLPKDGTIFGDPTIVSALALHGDRRVAGELADLNPSWIEAGAVKPEEIVSRIERDAVTAVVTPPFGVVQVPYFKSYLLACYEKPKPFFPPESGPGAGLPFFLVFTHTQGPSPCEVPPP
jgi:hypothetical protein